MKVESQFISTQPSEKWKNGHGETAHIAIYPKDADRNGDLFQWRLVHNVAYSDCSFKVLPGFDVCLLMLPNSDNTLLKRPHRLNHNDHETNVVWKPLVPYLYNGESTATFRPNSACEYLSFVFSRSLEAQFALETICALGFTDDGMRDKDGDGDSSLLIKESAPTQKILLGNFTIVYVITGAIHVQIEEDQSNRIVNAGETMIIERNDQAEPTDFAMTPVASMKDLFIESKESKSSHVRAASAGILLPKNSISI